MKSSKTSKTSSCVRKRSRTVKITSTAHGLTSQAGLIPVVKYLDKIGFEKTVEKNVSHSRGENADYHLSRTIGRTIGDRPRFIEESARKLTNKRGLSPVLRYEFRCRQFLLVSFSLAGKVRYNSYPFKT